MKGLRPSCCSIPRFPEVRPEHQIQGPKQLVLKRRVIAVRSALPGEPLLDRREVVLPTLSPSQVYRIIRVNGTALSEPHKEFQKVRCEVKEVDGRIHFSPSWDHPGPLIPKEKNLRFHQELLYPFCHFGAACQRRGLGPDLLQPSDSAAPSGA